MLILQCLTVMNYAFDIYDAEYKEISLCPTLNYAPVYMFRIHTINKI